MFIQQLINAISLGSVYALFALGFTLIFGVLEVINLSHGAVFMAGAFVSLAMVNTFHFPFWLATLIGTVAAGVIGLLINMLILKPLRARQAPHLAPMVATIGAGIFITSLAMGAFGVENQRYPAEIIPSQSWSFIWNNEEIYITLVDAMTIIATFILMLILVCIIQFSKRGKALKAIAENKKAALLLGINVESLFNSVSFLAGALGGAAGILNGVAYNALSPLMGQPILDKGIAVIILGGMGDIRGAVLGGLFLGFVEVFSVAFLSSDLKDAISFGLLFLILLIRPMGLFGKTLARKD